MNDAMPLRAAVELADVIAGQFKARTMTDQEAHDFAEMIRCGVEMIRCGVAIELAAEVVDIWNATTRRRQDVIRFHEPTLAEALDAMAREDRS